MFDHEDVKTLKIFEYHFRMSNQRSWSPKKYKVEGPNKHNPIQFMASQKSILQFFLYEFVVWFFSKI